MANSAVAVANSAVAVVDAATAAVATQDVAAVHNVELLLLLLLLLLRAMHPHAGGARSRIRSCNDAACKVRL